MAMVDHLVYAVADLDGGRSWFEEVTGVDPVAGGAHPGLGTHNALASFGSSYLELIAPDPGQPEPAAPRPFGIDRLARPGLVLFAVRPASGETLDDLVGRAVAAGHDPGPPVPMSRRRPDGVELSWRLTLPRESDGVPPFLIDWGDTPLPSDTAPGGVVLDALTVADPDPDAVRSVLTALGLDIDVKHAAEPALEAVVRGRHGPVTLPSATFRPEV